MYGYISIHSDDYTKKVNSRILEQYLISKLGFEKVASLIFSKELYGERIWVTGIPADPNGNYAFNTLDGIDEVNLVEINLPRSINNNLESVITGIAIAISNELSWYIDEDHGLS